jgi:hypothetical protein
MAKRLSNPDSQCDSLTDELERISRHRADTESLIPYAKRKGGIQRTSPFEIRNSKPVRDRGCVPNLVEKGKWRNLLLT